MKALLANRATCMARPISDVLEMKLDKSKIIVLVTTLATMLPTTVLSEVIYREINPDDTVVRVKSDAWQPEGYDVGTMIPAPYMKFANITIDGRDDEDDWTKADEIVVPLNFGNVEAASLKAIYTDENVFIRVRWKDETENRDHHPWIWDAGLEQYVEGPQIEDSMLLTFEAGCEWLPSFLAGYVYDYDAWRWLAARSDPLGQAVDSYGTVQSKFYPNLDFVEYDSRSTGKIWNMKFDTATDKISLFADWEELDRMYFLQSPIEKVYVRAVPDGQINKPVDFVMQIPAPESAPVDETAIYPQYLPLELDGQAGEVAAKGHWENGYWTVELRRTMETPARTMNDTVFNRMTQFAVHVFDQAERLDEASESDRLILQFIPPVGILVQA